jgi:hypothetical protein
MGVVESRDQRVYTATGAPVRRRENDIVGRVSVPPKRRHQKAFSLDFFIFFHEKVAVLCSPFQIIKYSTSTVAGLRLRHITLALRAWRVALYGSNDCPELTRNNSVCAVVLKFQKIHQSWVKMVDLSDVAHSQRSQG